MRFRKGKLTKENHMNLSREMRTKIEQFADAHMEELTADLTALMQINSVRTGALPGAPFGLGAKKALEAASALAEKKGFAVTNFDNYCRTADLNPGTEPCFDMLGHVDVVPAGDGWTVTDPFEPLLKDGILYGRGVADDKGGVVAALYAMQAVKELGIPVSKRCRLIIGSGEETGMEDVNYYYTKEAEAPMTATPDAEYPVTCGEKGRVAPCYDAVFAASTGKRELNYLKGGIAVNQVPASAVCEVEGVSMEEFEAKAALVTKETKVKFAAVEKDGNLVIRAEGRSAHGSTPELGINAVLGLAKLVLSLDLDPCEGLTILKNYCEVYPFGDFEGKAVGMAARDEVSGATSCAADIIRMTDTQFHAEVDFRTAICADAMDPVKILEESGKKIGAAVTISECIKSHYVPGDSDFVKTLNACYEEITGKPGAALCMGGNSYVHGTKGGVCFGYVANDAEACIHGPNEHLAVKELRDTVVIYACAIAELCR